MRPAEPGRNALLDAGSVLLASADLSKLSVNAVVAEAGMAKGSFYQHWPTRREYLVALLRNYHERLAGLVTAAMDDAEPGLPRLDAGMTAYLDECLSNPAMKRMLAQARTDSGLGSEVEARHTDFAHLATDDLKIIGWDSPEPIAELFVAAVSEVALQELNAGGPRPDLREGVRRLLQRNA
ncbi:MAG: TetR/AcrR family transcriptional regulator [Gordonia sp. (in: high G+C Gram-positive bacteria)]